MPSWLEFPPDAGTRLYLRRDAEDGQLYYVLRFRQTTDADRMDLRRHHWRPVKDLPEAWQGKMPTGKTGPGVVIPQSVKDRRRARPIIYDDMSEFQRQHQLPDCPRDAVPIGINARGDEVRERNGWRWVIRSGDNRWSGTETACDDPADILRGVNPGAWRHLAESIVDRTVKDRRVWREEDLRRLATVLVAPSTPRPMQVPHVSDPDESMDLLRKQLHSAILGRRDAANRHLNQEVMALSTRFPELASGLDLSPAVSAAVLDTLSDRGGLIGDSRIVRPGVPMGSFAAMDEFGLSPSAPADRMVIDGTMADLPAAVAAVDENLATRPDEGVIIAALPGHPEEEPVIDALRRRAGREWGIESCIWLPPTALGQPVVDPGLTLIAIGNRRQEVPEETPPQAMRYLVANYLSDLRRWTNDSRRSRRLLAPPDDHDDDAVMNSVPYQPMSGVGLPRTIHHRNHQTAMTRAQTRVMDMLPENISVDGMVSTALDMDVDELSSVLSPEQVDAVALAELTFERQRNFLLADEAGIGKGRALCASAAAWLCKDPSNRVVYLTSQAQVALDVLRDIKGIHQEALFGPPAMIGASIPHVDGVRLYSTPEERHDLFASDAFPDTRMAISTYNVFSRAMMGAVDNKPASDHLPPEWLERICADGNTMLILDEAHLCTNPASNRGVNIRRAIAGASRVMFASATPMKDSEGINLYKTCLPHGSPLRDSTALTDEIEPLMANNETALESLVGMLIEDGVYVRRSQSLADIVFRNGLPTDAELERNLRVLRGVANLASYLVTNANFIRQSQGTAIQSASLAITGTQPRFADATHQAGYIRIEEGERLSDMAFSPFSPLSQMISTSLQACKVDQTARLALSELEAGRKPMISLEMTGGSWLARQAGIRRERSDPPLTLRDRLRSSIESIFISRPLEWNNNEKIDLRSYSEGLEGHYNRLLEIIDHIEDMPAIPIDALIDHIREAGHPVAEISGRSHTLSPTGIISRRHNNPTLKRRAMDEYNDGIADVLVFSGAGATGASYHSDPSFGDQRPRTMIQMEPSTKVIEYVQSMGRSNRYNQVSPPEYINVITGVAAEKRALAYLNRALHRFGAIVDGDRDHSAVIDDVPDLVNPMGNLAAINLLLAEPYLARKMGIYVNRISHVQGNDTLQRMHHDDSTIRRVLLQCILLEDDEQGRLFDTLNAMYEGLVADLDRMGQNPLKTPVLTGHVEIHDRQDYHLDDNSFQMDGHDDDAASSAFAARTSLHNATWHRSSALTWKDVTDRCANAVSSGHSPAAEADRIAATLKAEDTDIERMRPMLANLQALEPGSVLRTDNGDMVIVADYRPPPTELASRLPVMHNFEVISPGEQHPRWVSLPSLMNGILHNDRPNRVGHVNDNNPSVTDYWQITARRATRIPIQLLTGNPLTIMRTAKQQRRRSDVDYQVMSVTDQAGNTYRAGVNRDPTKLDLQRVPQPLRATTVLAAMVPEEDVGRVVAAQPHPSVPERNWIFIAGDKTDHKLRIRLPPLQRERYDFWARDTGPAIYELLHGHTLPVRSSIRPGRPRNQGCTLDLSTPSEAATARMLTALMDRHRQIKLTSQAVEMRTWYADWYRRQTAADPTYRGLVDVDGVTADELMSVAASHKPPAPELLVSMQGSGEMRPFRVEMTGLTHDRLLFTMPPYDGLHAGFWRSKPGRTIWKTLSGKDLPRGAATGDDRFGVVMLDGTRARQVLGNLLDYVRQNGFSATCPGDQHDPRQEVNNSLAVA